MKKIAIWSIIAMYALIPLSSIASNDFEIIPKAGDTKNVIDAVSGVGAQWGKVRDTYNKKAGELNLWEQMASGIMTRDTLLDYVVYLVRFLSQIGLVIGVVMIIYAGYLYATSIFNPSGMSKGKSAIINAIIGVLVVAFSYAIMKLLTSAFLS